MKLQMQKMHLGPPPLVMTIKQTEGYQHSTEELTVSKNLPHKVTNAQLDRMLITNAVSFFFLPYLPLPFLPLL